MIKGEHRGHGQVCGRIQVVLPSGNIAKHGYRVAGENVMSHNFFRGLKFAVPVGLILWGLLFLALSMLAGCASVLPDYVAPELEHMSHATQHEPFTSTPTRYGANIASVVVGYNLPHHFNVELAEGVDLNKHYPQSNQFGEIEGPREQFSARIRYMIEVRK